jgi:hypothetical protein
VTSWRIPAGSRPLPRAVLQGGLALACLMAGVEGCSRPSGQEEARLAAPPRAVGQGGWVELDRGLAAPPAGEDAAVALDAVRHRVLLYGGKDDHDRNRDELWALDYATRSWTELVPEGDRPPPREDHTLVLDEANDALVLFGGEDGSTSNQTWIFDLAANRWSDVTSASAPALEAHVAIYDPLGARMVVFGGVREEKAHKDEKVLENTTWAMDLDRTSSSWCSWTKLATEGEPPCPRREHRAAYDPRRHRLIVFGGRERTKKSFLNDLWLLDLHELRWSAPETTGERPDPIRQTALGYDPEADLLTVFGGEIYVRREGEDDEFPVDEVWVLDLGSWVWFDRTPHPPPMYDHLGVFVPELGGTLIYGGSSQWPGKEHGTWLLSVR